jgi:hypothetical protein
MHADEAGQLDGPWSSAIVALNERAAEPGDEFGKA